MSLELIRYLECDCNNERIFRGAVLKAHSAEIKTVNCDDIDRMSMNAAVEGLTFNKLMVKLSHTDTSWAKNIQ